MSGVSKRKGAGVSGEELERMLAEVWGAVLRKIRRTEMREEAVTLAAEGIEGCEEGTAWVFISALQVRTLYSAMAAGSDSTTGTIAYHPSFSSSDLDGSTECLPIGVIIN